MAIPYEDNIRCGILGIKQKKRNIQKVGLAKVSGVGAYDEYQDEKKPNYVALWVFLRGQAH